MLKGPGYFITGTDTDVGKTVVSTILALGLDGCYWKPIQSGEPKDSDFVRRFVDSSRVFDETYVFSRPLSPHLAAKLEGGRVDLDKIETPDTSRTLIVEGAGGVLVPLNEGHFVLDLIEKLKFEVLLVARSSLGTINHTLSTLKILRDRGLAIKGVVLVGNLNPENKKAIEFYGHVPVLAEIPPMTEFSSQKFLEIFSQFKESERPYEHVDFL